jgi:hypothetical protein
MAPLQRSLHGAAPARDYPELSESEGRNVHQIVLSPHGRAQAEDGG